MNTSDQFYEVLGVRAGASRQELKAAYRDLTKVWHPDRFTHDPRLQAKAEEKLKQINDAYEQLISGKTPRRHRPAVTDYGAQRTGRSPVAVHKSTSLTSILIFLILFGAVFVFTIRLLHTKANQAAREAIEQSNPDSTDGNTPKINDTASARTTNETSLPETKAAEQESMPTITVVIDSATGLLARSECPTKIRMTYRSGNEPRAFCNIHPASPSNPNHKSLKKMDSSTDDSTSQLSAP